MPWLADSDLGAARRFARGMSGAATVAECQGRARAGLAELVPADVSTWDRVELATGAVRHDAQPAETEPRGAFAELVGRASDHPLLRAHARERRTALRMSEAVEPRRLARSQLYGDVLCPSGAQYGIAIGIRTGRGEAVVAGLGRGECQFSDRDRDMLDLVRGDLEGAWRAAEARERLTRALASSPLPNTAVLLLDCCGEIAHSSVDAERWLAEHFGIAEHPGWLPEPIAAWVAVPPRPALVSERGGRRLTVHMLPGDPHALLLEEDVASFRPEALRRLGLSARDTEMLCAVAATDDEEELAAELFLSPHAVRVRLERIEQKLDVHTAREAVAQALSESV